LSEGK